MKRLDKLLSKTESFQVVSIYIIINLLITSIAFSADSSQTFRKENTLYPYAPSEWFLKGYFTACEKDPNYVFGPVLDFVSKLGGKTTWLIENTELENIKKASEEGKKTEYSLYLEAILPDRTEYWVFVVQPYESAQEWYDARRAYHGRKAEAYYGKSKNERELALGHGFDIKAELRFWIENGETSLKVPEDVLMNKYYIKPIFDLGKGTIINQ